MKCRWGAWPWWKRREWSEALDIERTFSLWLCWPQSIAIFIRYNAANWQVQRCQEENHGIETAVNPVTHKTPTRTQMKGCYLRSSCNWLLTLFLMIGCIVNTDALGDRISGLSNTRNVKCFTFYCPSSLYVRQSRTYPNRGYSCSGVQ